MPLTTRNNQAQVMLTNYKAQQGWYDDQETIINKKFKL